ncbi:MAG: hypothetical protein AVDCRST_MAG30-2030 [uncultured Solirubrobacteraceae bacterium]|uniref:Transcobalamin-like C-terminal domain-containing protein n=1 Tax=uncultured Solirubrobacteraceae bacterium TaxID=1162706 RepID=A0A6J4SR19_9ACTN|nr:MAG: hypothetical protein AVDCRST_MAG30-2030 [uncultured Solirubrobacteraceae bacterium]
MNRAALLLALLLAALGAAGCGLGESGSERSAEGVTLRVTEDFGSERVARASEARVPPGDTVMRLLRRRVDTDTRYGGTFVQELEGRAGGAQEGRRIDWFYYVNGIEAEVGAAEFKLSAGDRVWWDLHDWGEAMRIPAVVGSFPEPFLTGYRGKRIPVRIECARGVVRECDEVAERLDRAGVQKTSRAVVSQRDEGAVLRVLVGQWKDIRLDPTALRIERGPEQSGVYARFDATGRRLDVLDPRGRVARQLTDGAGLIAATRQEDRQPVWVVTGTDAVGLAAAAAALEESLLAQRFAIAIENGQAVPAPVTVPGPGTGTTP